MKSKCYSVRLCHYKALLKGSKGFLKLPQMFIGDPREFPVSIQRLRDFQNCLKRASRELQESIKRASRELQESFRRASGELQESFRRASKELQKSFKRASRKLQESFNFLLYRAYRELLKSFWRVLENSRKQEKVAYEDCSDPLPIMENSIIFFFMFFFSRFIIFTYT